MTRTFNIIVNPAAGQNDHILNTFNSIFHPSDIDWDISITHGPGDAHDHAKHLAGEVDVVGVYGGDGTIGEVATALLGSETPLMVFAGGTGNAFVRALDLPLDIAEAARIFANKARHVIRKVDTGVVNGDHAKQGTTGVLTVGGATGVIAQTIRNASRGEKDDQGMLAYTISLLREMTEAASTTYTLTLDGDTQTIEGVSIFVANAGEFGWQGISFFDEVDIIDGKLDVYAIRSSDVFTVLNAFLDASSLVQTTVNMPHWRAAEVTIEADTEETFFFDGEGSSPLPVTVTTQPESLCVVVPK